MSGLKARISQRIAETGPISLGDYMAMCLFDPAEGYYTTREPFGTTGDFTTAPEISQMFGELVALWLYSAWRTAGAPRRALLAEIGPGRGTLMRDMARTLARIDPAWREMFDVRLVEASPRLEAVQRETLAGTPATWHRTVADLPEAPLFIVGNELFDALPLRQFVKLAEGWRERVVALGAGDELVFAAGPAGLDAAALPADAADAPEGSIFEFAPARTGLMQAIALHVASHGGAGLFLDYGHLAPGIGDTFQAVRAHAYQDVLDEPGRADLTSHVDFAALGAAARAAGVQAQAVTQGAFLLSMGLLERAGRLGADKDAAGREAISRAVERLAGPDEMGDLFKVLAIAPRLDGLPGLPPT